MAFFNIGSKTGMAGLKPLTIAVSSTLLFACASTNNTNVNTGNAPIVSTPSTPNAPADVYTGVLDQATLDELEDLLQATDMTMVEGDALTVQRYGDLWDRVRRGYRMSEINNGRIEAQKSWFYSRQDYINRLTARTSRYLHHTVTEAERRGIPTELALLPIIESSYDPSATSNAAAAGLWQFIPSTGRIYGLNQSTTYDGRRDIIESTRAAYDFLTSLYNQFGSWELALAAYNAGPGRIQRAIDANRNAGLPTDYWSLRLPTETMNYVPRFMAVAQIVKNPQSYGVYLPAIANHSHFRAVPANFGVSLYDVSNVTGVPVDELRLLNPSLINYSVDASGPGRVIIPNSVPSSADTKLKALQGMGYGASTYVASSYVQPNMGVQNPSSRQELASANALPATGAGVTVNNSIIQEPSLTQEERDFIAAQIQANSTENIQPIARDGNIELNAIQTQQSVLEARGETKSLSYNAPAGAGTPAVAPSNNTYIPPVSTAPTITAKAERYKVVAGDTLTGIAVAHGLSVSQLASYNGIPANTQVKTGQRLWLIPGKVSTVAKDTAKPTVKTSAHTVQSGESLTSVARKYNMSVQDLAVLNGLSVTDGILINQKLKVSGTPVKSSGSTSSSSGNTSSSNSANTSTYKVQSGDTLTAIAKKLGVSNADIAALNSFNANSPLIAGQTIKVPATNAQVERKLNNQSVKYTVQSGDSLTSVANKYGISVVELATANNLSRTAGLIRGRTITIPAAGTVKVARQTTKNDDKASRNDNSDNTARGNVIKSTENYTVKAGESLNALASRYGVSARDLAATNKLPANAQLQRGQTIKVPKLTDTYKVKSGDSLNSVAKKFGISVAELAKMNGLGTDAQLKINQTLTVPNK
ncbi:LysM peptidoglycan-binding domain-containing protein [Moraxella bovis]|uniref:LysM peptidoglycan-binding domain-containing protein n=1 Tax=Moraxella bovis TaxID=476 RepID=UPI002226DF30|nr:LysM peptidoglycan-binding domain-containing protein [Moraxella bovis]UYZ69199.1 LysM peptidoglycan-binding domain-containing protein [Moraxella bovis]UZA26771.1 LysM peptidoglycan-binding domain-containing protein [Moraxella bovis]UZA38697.1 LysM peptidoglycan-binding domain-containing protein [Moraxella bovis]UZA42394.1 LysM peptidoglycan-binding domain-containing protein [Moraxella bovis]